MMNTTVTTTSTAEPAMSVDNQADAITELLLGSDKPAKQPKKKPTKDEEEEDQNLDSDLPDEALDDLDADEEPLDTEGDDEDDEVDAEEDDDDDDDVSWNSVLGVDEEKLAFDEKGNVLGIKTKVDGKEAVVKLNDLVAGYQTNKYVTQKAQAVAAEKKAVHEEKQYVAQVYTERLGNVDSLVDFFTKKLTDDYEGVDWQRLRAQNPAEYVALQHDFQQRATMVEQAKAAIAEDSARAMQERQQQDKQEQSAYLAKEFQMMIHRNPTWADASIRESSMKELKGFANARYGYSEDELSNVTDSRVIEVLKDAMKSFKTSKVIDEKKAKPVPKFQKSAGSSKSNVSKLDRLIKRAKTSTGSNKRYHQTDAIAELLIGDMRK
jgi:hypothetical protein